MSMTAADNRISRGEGNEPAIDWQERAQDVWNDPAWPEAAADYHRKRGELPLVVETDSQRLAQLRRLLDNSVSLERAWAELDQRRHDGAPQATVEALMFSLRSRGVQALGEPDTLRRLSELNNTQLREVAVRLWKLKPEIARAWTPEEVRALVAARKRLT